ncbi:MAG TPA: YceI family protein [Longimicrobium sp.]|nr:YceI family protein [Longimicrobium sp.]
MSIATETTTTTWQIDPAHTTVEFSLKHLMISTVRGHFGAVSGTIVLDEAHPALSSATAEIDVTSIDTRQEQRDAHLRSPDFFDVEVFPRITFRSTRIEALGGGRYDVHGELTIRDVTREVVLQTTDEGRGGDPWGGERAAFSATTRIDRRDYGLTWNQALETGGVLVGNDIKITLEVQAVKAA